MIGRLTGNVVAEDTDGTITLDVQGVGYEVTLPNGALPRAARDNTGRVVLFIHTRLRQDSLDLFGFASELERSIFGLLLSVPNVGPKIALGVLSALPPEELAAAVGRGDLARLNKVSGVGKKTAERLVVELKEKLPLLALTKAVEGRGKAHGDEERLRGALVTMGYKSAEAERALSAVRMRMGTEPLADLLRAALAFLTR